MENKYPDEFFISLFRERIENECLNTTKPILNIYIVKTMLYSDSIRIYWSADNWLPEKSSYCQKIYFNNFSYPLSLLEQNYRDYKINQVI